MIPQPSAVEGVRATYDQSCVFLAEQFERLDPDLKILGIQPFTQIVL
jgi:hypothetical protein